MPNLLVIKFSKLRKQKSLAIPNVGIFVRKECIYILSMYTSDALGVRCFNEPNELLLMGI